MPERAAGPGRLIPAGGVPPAPEPPAFPDVETASDRYARRFAGRVGAWFLEVQARLTLELLAPDAGARVLDVGGGHAQLTGPLCDAGFDVTVLGSDARCARRVAAWTEAGRARFEVGDPMRAPFADQAFDVVLAFRLLPHVERWPALVAELARLARRAVVVDYPTRRSANAFADALFAAKRGVEGDTRPFRVFRDGEIRDAFAGAGFGLAARRPEFFFPMALHRALGAAGLSGALERGARGLGLVALLGSPVVARAERHG